MKNKLFRLFAVTVGMFFLISSAWAEDGLRLHYSFDKASGTVIHDETGNGYDGTMKNEAALKSMYQNTVLNLGSKNGYIDLGSKIGELIGSLRNFTISTYICIDTQTSLSAGNFIFSFSNSNDIANAKNGNMFLSARNQRYAISKTNWSEESGFELGQQLTKGQWLCVTYTQKENAGKLYVDGKLVKEGQISLFPSDLGNTRYNFIGRSPYVGDAYLKNTLLSDFKVYDKTLTLAEIGMLGSRLDNLNLAYRKQELTEAKTSLTINDGLEEVRSNIPLPIQMDNNITVSWASSHPEFIETNGTVTRPKIGKSNETVKLTATLSKNGLSETKEFTLVVLPFLSNAGSIQKDYEYLLSQWLGKCITEQVSLVNTTVEGSVVKWRSNDSEYISDQGKILKLPAKGEGNKSVLMEATISKGDESITKNFDVCISEDEGHAAYLFAYFTGNTGNEEAIRFAISRDGFDYKSLNNNEPIISSAAISTKGGVRDPHILRGTNDNMFYMVVTDMKSAEGWSSNHAIVLLKSADLTNWTSSKIDIKQYPEFSNTTRAWAPQTIYDPTVNKYMVYFSIASPSTADVIYYAYVNQNFTAFEEAPRILFTHPEGKSCIDGDIIYRNGKYNLFFKTEGDGNGIKKAVSESLTSGYKLINKYLQSTTEAVEGSCVFKLINSERYILMYDLYTTGKYQFTESKDLENFKITDEVVSMDFHPRHGTVIPITEEEGERLMAKWGTTKELDIISSASESVKKDNWIKNSSTKTIYLPIKEGTNLKSFNPEFIVLPGVTLSPLTPQDFTTGNVNYTTSLNGNSKTYSVTAKMNKNPVLEGFYADPEVLYSKKTNKFYIYPTTDGYAKWGGYSFSVFSSDDLVNWSNEGVILDLSINQVSWANGNAWAPCVEEKMIDGNYKYFFYYSGNPVAGGGKQIGVAVADNPTGPFVDSGKSLINTKPSGISSGQEIDPDVFTDPKTSKTYLYWGNGYMAGAELNDDMVSVKPNTVKVMTPSDNTFREGVYVFHRNDKYYFLWSQDDTGSENYKVRYGTSNSPLGAINVPSNNIVIQKSIAQEIYATGHCSVVQVPGKDEWYIVYHRFRRPRVDSPGNHREVCIDKLEFNKDGSIKQIIPTLEGIEKVMLPDPSSIENKELANQNLDVYPNPVEDKITVFGKRDCSLYIYDSSGKNVMQTTLLTDNQTINMSNLLAGVYVVVVDDNHQLFRNIIIKK